MISVRSIINKKGFTLVELMIVIAVIAILATLALFGLSGAQKGARDTQRVSILNNMRTAMERYNADKNQYPQGVFSQVYYSLTNNTYLPTTVNDPGCGTGAVNVGSSYTTGGVAVPCGAGSPQYSINAGATAYTLYLLNKESNGGSYVVLSPQ